MLAQVFVVLLLGHAFLKVQGLVTLEIIRNITTVTNDSRGRILKMEQEVGATDSMVEILGAQILLESDHSDVDEIEQTITAAIRTVCSELLTHLEKPLLESFSQPERLPTHRCPPVINGFHSFLEAAVKFLHAVQEKQMQWQWKVDSSVFDGLMWLQALWASRRANKRNRSFIEQQTFMYTSTGCFTDKHEVLRSDVEIVEYMNDLIDTFR